MKAMPIISPELHGLLDEIVKDPRSALRLKPRRALLPWLESGESVGANPIHASHAEKYLLAAHRDELAKLLAEGAWITCLDGIDFLQTARTRDGAPARMREYQAEWRARCQDVLAVGGPGNAELTDGVALLRTAFENSVPPDVLATASLALAPSDLGRCSLAMSLSSSDPVASIRILQRLGARPVDAILKSDALNILGAVLARFEWLDLAHEAYLRSREARPERNLAVFSLFNLSCFLGDEPGALRHSKELQGQFNVDDLFLREAADIIGKWASGVSRTSRERAAKTIRRVHLHLSPPALALADAVVKTSSGGREQ